MKRELGILAASIALALLSAGLGLAGEEKKAAQNPSPEKSVTFDMREVSAFGLREDRSRAAHTITRGQYVQCSTVPDKEVKLYPKLKSKHPLYGKVTFGMSRDDPKAGVEYHFVIDESGEKPAEPQPAEGHPGGSKAGGEASLLQRLAAKFFGTPSPAPPPVKPEKKPVGYDRLYFDANRDLDLTNDRVLLPMKDPPAEADPYPSSSRQKMIFDYVSIPFDFGPGLGIRPFRLLPRLEIEDYQGRRYYALFFVAALARQGDIHLGPQYYNAVLAQPYGITGRFDQPGTALFLTPGGSSHGEEYWWGSEELRAMRRIDGNYYSASVTPLGDKLTVKLYQGECGTFKLGAGKRDLKRLSMTGSLGSRNSAVAVGDVTFSPITDRQTTTECRVPVGDYLPSLLNAEYGRLRIEISDNYHSDGRPRDAGARQYLFKIRKERPFVLDFSCQPKVLFASPAKEQTLKPGDTLQVAAVLTDPSLDIMIRGLDDTTRKQKEVIKLGDGKAQSIERQLSLDPVVTITNSSGKTVAEGKMPFG